MAYCDGPMPRHHLAKIKAAEKQVEPGKKTMQWTEYATRIAKLPSIALRHICVDAQEAIDTMPDGINAGEIHICELELHRRAKNKVCRKKEYDDALSEMYTILKQAGYNSFEMIDDLRDLVNDSQRPAAEDAYGLISKEERRQFKRDLALAKNVPSA